MIDATVCDSFRRELLALEPHRAGDAFMIALYAAGATLTRSTTLYTPAREVAGAGYTPGGAVLVGFTVTLRDGVASLAWRTDPIWPVATITARGALIYNASKGHRAVAVLDFGEDVTSTNGRFTVVLPDPIVRLL